ncbi:MAG TPA: cytochrome c peroxidase, partial [Lacipirellulaceae bacterium]|nr:cytochrome c peroxidase [Lacipirellulaceae bacterium]
PSLTAGIPGDGPLTNEQLAVWLANPKNHVVLEPELPLGLAAGAAEIKGLDENPLTRAKIELGRQLYFDTRLSVDSSVSCASCHDPDAGYASHDRFGVGVRGQMGARNSPTAYNRILSGPQFWDGRADSLEEQAKGPIANPIEMSNTHEACVACLQKIPGYVAQFHAIFPDGVTIDNAAKAIASFERVIVTGPAPWDVHLDLQTFEDAWSVELEDLEALAEDDPELLAEYRALQAAAAAQPISASAIRGGELFFSDKAGCTACHVGANFSDELYHNLGVGMEVDEPDLGRYIVTEEEKDKGAFKTPTVRNVSQTAPYMHDGSQATLEEVVEWYVKGGHPNPWLDEKVKKLDLTDQDKADLVAFMAEGLLGELPVVERGRLPEDPEGEAEPDAEAGG